MRFCKKSIKRWKVLRTCWPQSQLSLNISYHFDFHYYLWTSDFSHKDSSKHYRCEWSFLGCQLIKALSWVLWLCIPLKCLRLYLVHPELIINICWMNVWIIKCSIFNIHVWKYPQRMGLVLTAQRKFST